MARQRKTWTWVYSPGKKPRVSLPGVNPEPVASFSEAAAIFRQAPWKKVG